MKPVRTEDLAARLFSGDRFAFQFGMRRGDGDWFQLDATPSAPVLERQRWFRDTPDRCFVWLDEAAEAAAEAITLFGGFVPGFPIPASANSRDALLALANHWEPDFLLLRRDGSGEYRLVAGAVCFPSSWDVREKLGHDVTHIHGVVPTLNPTLGTKIRTFLARLTPEGVFERENWGLAAHGELNAHPERGLPRLDSTARIASTWLRVEHQAFRALPASGGLLFTIRLTVHPLSEVLTTPATRDDFARQLATMPDEIATYKGIAPARAALLSELGHTAAT